MIHTTGNKMEKRQTLKNIDFEFSYSISLFNIILIIGHLLVVGRLDYYI